MLTDGIDFLVIQLIHIFKVRAHSINQFFNISFYMKLYQNKLDFKVNSVPHSFFKCSAEEIRVSEKSTVQDAIKNSITWFETSLKSFQKLQLVISYIPPSSRYGKAIEEDRKFAINS